MASPAEPNCLAPAYSASSNRITTSGYSYDAAGDVTGDGTYTYSWDAEGRLTKVVNGGGTAVSTNTYNALGQRVRDKGDGVVNPLTVDEAYGAGGQLLWRYTGSSTYSTQRAFVAFNGRILAEYYGGSPGGTLFDHPDELGSNTTSTSYSGSDCQEKLFYPFGQFWTGTASCGTQQVFAQLPDYDPETNQYNTLARHYSPTGRWMSPDPGGLKVFNPADPQTWNMYAYVRNNPTTLFDPNGLADYYVFLPLVSGNVSSQWAAIKAEAPSHGNTVTFFTGEGPKGATTANFETALQTPGANVIFSGHANLDQNTGNTVGIDLGPADSMGSSHAVGDNPTALAPDGLPESMVTDQLNANSVALFGCNTNALLTDFSGTTFIGTQPATNTEAQDAGARAYTDALVRNGSMDQATTAAATSMVSTTNQANQNPNRETTYPTPQVCTTDANGTTTCK